MTARAGLRLLFAGLALAAAALARTEVDSPPGSVPPPAGERLVLHTSAGDVVVSFFTAEAPRHAAQILALARLGAYDSVQFIRVDPQGYYVQLGDITQRDLPLTPAQRAADRRIPAEFSALLHVRGTISMARHPADPDSARSSLVFVLRDSPHFDPPAARFTVVGRVDRGLDVLESFGRYLQPGSDAPTVPLTVLKANVVPAGELAQMALRPLRPVERSGGSRTPGREERLIRLAAVGLAAVAAVLLAAFVAARRESAGRWTRSLVLLGILACCFVLLVLLVPAAPGRLWLGAGLLAAGMGAVKLMTFFDAER
jgi:cyclophilin family peptidyl-prolyl cis-trans isomerase